MQLNSWLRDSNRVRLTTYHFFVEFPSLGQSIRNKKKTFLKQEVLLDLLIFNIFFNSVYTASPRLHFKYKQFFFPVFYSLLFRSILFTANIPLFYRLLQSILKVVRFKFPAQNSNLALRPIT
jgi:hypothetical protein